MKRILILMVLVSSQAISAVFSAHEIEILKHNFLANVQENGAIVASPSKQNPNYYYDWIRDSAIAMSLIETWYETNPTSQYRNLLSQYVNWTQKIQQLSDPIPNHDILGEPKFYIEGQVFDGPWGRPQNDGPALRASVLIRFANQLLDHNELDYVKTHLYHGGLEPKTMGAIKMDLEYIAHHWRDANFDLWEEVYGHHFFTAMAQQLALKEGAVLARRLHDENAAFFYEGQAQLLNQRLEQHLDRENEIIQATLLPHSNPQKTLELDSSVILGLLINPHEQGVFSINGVYSHNTFDALHEQFNAMFPINEYKPGAILFGRYPGDTYDGYNTHGEGNPWFILTATAAEYYFTLADAQALKDNNRTLIKHYLNLGSNYLYLIKKYGSNLSLSEQINLNTGIQQGASSLTWSYVSVLRAIELEKKVLSRITD